MKKPGRFAAGVIASLGLTLATAAAYAQPGSMRGGMQHQQGGQQHAGMQHTGMQHGMKGEMGSRAAGHGPAANDAAQSLMTPEERTAMREKMRNATTPEERQKLALSMRAEMQKRATEKRIALPEARGPRAGAALVAPATNEHVH